MTALGVGEIRPGIVAYLEESVLRDSNDVEWFSGKGSKHGSPERRPFLCVSVVGDEYTWVPITTEPRTGAGYQRLNLESSWRTGGDQACFGNQWVRLDQYLVDGANLYSGPVTEFIAASANECTTEMTRSLLSTAGVAAVVAEIAKQQRRKEKVSNA